MTRLATLLLLAVLAALLGLAIAATVPVHTSAPYCLSHGAHGQVGDATVCWQLPIRPIRRLT